MPSRGFGVQFMPGADQPPGEVNGRTGAPRTPVQEAIQVLSLRLPKVFGARGILPEGLATAPGGMGQPGAQGNVAAAALAQMAGLPPGMAPPSVPAPMPLPPMGGPSGPSQPSPPWSVPDTPDRPRPDTVYRTPSPPSSTPPPNVGFPSLPAPVPIPVGPPPSGAGSADILNLPPIASAPPMFQRPTYKQDLLDMYARFSGGGY